MKPQSAGPAFADRARAALLGHACGDRFGAPLEFVSDASVRTRKVVLGNWTDDTHMSLYLGEAILAHGPGPLRPDPCDRTHSARRWARPSSAGSMTH